MQNQTKLLSKINQWMEQTQFVNLMLHMELFSNFMNTLMILLKPQQSALLKMQVFTQQLKQI
jgi:hypothetical protein